MYSNYLTFARFFQSHIYSLTSYKHLNFVPVKKDSISTMIHLVKVPINIENLYPFFPFKINGILNFKRRLYEISHSNVVIQAKTKKQHDKSTNKH
ncbi:hypothetical protein Y001_10730 [Staphylococcus aureus MUF256]|nr:hypothetical protein Y001_10730 [Staphylococcus aureus MUF256]